METHKSPRGCCCCPFRTICMTRLGKYSARLSYVASWQKTSRGMWTDACPGRSELSYLCGQTNQGDVWLCVQVRSSVSYACKCDGFMGHVHIHITFAERFIFCSSRQLGMCHSLLISHTAKVTLGDTQSYKQTPAPPEDRQMEGAGA